MRTRLDSRLRPFALAYLRLARRLWWRIPSRLRDTRAARLFGTHLHRVVLRYQPRTQNHSTFFFRNRPELELLSRVADRLDRGSELKLAVLGCSKGAEVYSMAYALRTARPDLKLHITAIDISQQVLDFARAGVYSLVSASALDEGGTSGPAGEVASFTNRDQLVSIFAFTTDGELNAMFDRVDAQAKIKAWLKEGIAWHRADVADPQLRDLVGAQDIVIANRFLCHMEPPSAERYLRAIAGLVRPGGHLFVSGVDLDIRERVASEMGWRPVSDLVREVYEGDITLMHDWPLEYWASEPFEAKKRNPSMRYTAAFRLGLQAWVMASLIDWPGVAASLTDCGLFDALF